MCLYTKHMPKRAEKDITVYKRLEIRLGILTTPHQLEHVFSRRIAAADVNPFKKQVTLLKWLWKRLTLRHVMIEEGIHSYTTQAMSISYCGCNHVVIESTIPAGTWYVKGIDGDIASGEIRLDKIVRYGCDSIEDDANRLFENLWK